MRLRTFHTTKYAYPTQAVESHNEMRLMPLTDDDQTCLDFRLMVRPAARVFAYDLPSGRVHFIDTRIVHAEMVIEAESLVVTHRQNPFQALPQSDTDDTFYNRESVRQDYAEFLSPTARVPLHPETDRIAAVARKQASGAGPVAFLMALNRQLYRVLTYAPGTTNVNTTIQNVLDQKQGVCQDFAHLMLAVCRRQRIPARYVSGYLFTGPDTGQQKSGQESERFPQTPSAAVSGNAMHAWVECLLPNNRWHGFDPTNNLLTNDCYIKVHVGRDYADVPPIRGIYRGPSAHAMEVSVRVVADEL